MALTRRGVPGKEREHVGIDRVNGVENVLRACRIPLLITIRQFANSDRNADVREILLGIEDLGGEGSRCDDGVEKRFCTHLDYASDELALGIGVKNGR